MASPVLIGGGSVTAVLRYLKAGYRIELANGSSMYEKAVAGVEELLADPRFNHIRKRLDAVFDEEYGEEEFAE